MSSALISRSLKTGLTVEFPNSAGIDIVKNLHYVALKFNDQGEQTVEHLRVSPKIWNGWRIGGRKMESSKWRWRRRAYTGNVACYIASTLQPRPKAETMPILSALVPNPVDPLQSDLSQN